MGGKFLIAAIVLLLPSAVLAVPPVVDRESASPVTTVTARDIQQLPTTRDLKQILDLHNQLRTDVHAQPLR